MKKVVLVKPALDLPAGAVIGLQDYDAEALVNSGVAEYVPDDARLVVNKDFSEDNKNLKSECITIEDLEKEKNAKK